jgi:hypothetical protein
MLGLVLGCFYDLKNVLHFLHTVNPSAQYNMHIQYIILCFL